MPLLIYQNNFLDAASLIYILKKKKNISLGMLMYGTGFTVHVHNPIIIDAQKHDHMKG